MNKKILTVGLITLLTGCFKPNIEEIKDFTGDGIPDIMTSVSGRNVNYLFIGQTNGSFIRAEELYNESEFDGFKTDGGQIYIFNGNHYMPIPKKE